MREMRAEILAQMVCSNTKQRAKKMQCARDAILRACGRSLWRLYSAIQSRWQMRAEILAQMVRSNTKPIAKKM